MKPNPANYESWSDPAGGQWIKVKNGFFKDTVWRPVDMTMGEENEDGSAPLNFTCEFFGPVPEKIAAFEKIATAIIRDIIQSMVDADNGK